MKRSRQWLVWGVVVLVVGVSGYRIATRSRKAAEVVSLPVAVKIQPPRYDKVYDILNLSGTLSAEEEANAYSKVPGKLARYVKFEGDRVAKDEIIAWIERDEVGVTYSLSPVKSPLTGVLAQRFVDIGESVAPAIGAPGTPVARVVNPQALEVVVYVIEKDFPRIKKGQNARIRVAAYPQTVFSGRVSRVAPVVDRLSKTVRVVVSLGPAADPLTSGMFADVELIVGEKAKALLLPREAVLRQNQQHYVYVVSGDRAVRRNVALGWSQGALTEITQGLTPDEPVVVEGQTRLTEGAQVKVLKEGE